MGGRELSLLGCGLWAQSAIGNKPRKKTSPARQLFFFFSICDWMNMNEQIEKRNKEMRLKKLMGMEMKSTKCLWLVELECLWASAAEESKLFLFSSFLLCGGGAREEREEKKEKSRCKRKSGAPWPTINQMKRLSGVWFVGGYERRAPSPQKNSISWNSSFHSISSSLVDLSFL